MKFRCSVPVPARPRELVVGQREVIEPDQLVARAARKRPIACTKMRERVAASGNASAGSASWCFRIHGTCA